LFEGFESGGGGYAHVSLIVKPGLRAGAVS
jgi:hypothetical protein